MSNLAKIRDISDKYDISARTLRYYEEMGLIESLRSDDYAYRMYDEYAIKRLEQILILRRLNISIKDIKRIFNTTGSEVVLEVLENKVNDIDEETSLLYELKKIIIEFINQIKRCDFFNESDVKLLYEKAKEIETQIVDADNVKNTITAKQFVEVTDRLQDKKIRIVYLPPATVASAYFAGPDPEMHANQSIDQFVKSTNLTELKPDLRHYGFNRDINGTHGYEVWVTIPDDMEVHEPLTKKFFKGGLYAAHTISMGAFDEWNVLNMWLAENAVYEMNSEGKGQECMFGALEEHINYFNHVKLENTEPDDMQLDLLMPVREK